MNGIYMVAFCVVLAAGLKGRDHEPDGICLSTILFNLKPLDT